jgi:hypothetical protein
MHPALSKLCRRSCEGAEGADSEACDREHRHEFTVKVHDPMVRALAREACVMIELGERGDSDCKGPSS